MIVGHSLSSGGVQFVGSTKSTFNYVIATSCSQTVPAAAQVGDLLIAVVMHRDTMSSTPSGWTLVDTVACASSSIAIGFQRLSVYSKTAVSGDLGATPSWTQASSQRMAVEILVFRQAGGCSVVAYADAHADNSAASSFAMPISTATADKQVGLSAASYVLTGGVAVMNVVWTGSTQDTPASMTDNRLCVGYKRMNNGDTTNGSTTDDSTGANGGWTGVTVIIG